MYRLPKPALYGLAVAFAAAALLYAVLWMLYGSRALPVELGFDNKYVAADRSEYIQSVHQGSPAERAGLRAGDRIVALDGIPLKGEETLARIWKIHRPGDGVDLTVVRPGNPLPMVVHGVFRLSPSGAEERGPIHSVGLTILNLYPFVFLVVGFAVLFLRVNERNAWLIALLFSAFAAVPNFENDFLAVPPLLRAFAVSYRIVFGNFVAGIFYFFFAVFPTPSPIERRAPWLKWAGLVLMACLATLDLFRAFSNTVGLPSWLLSRQGHVAFSSINYGFIALGFASLIWNDLVVSSTEDRRKIRVIMWGTLVGVVPVTLSLAAVDFFEYSLSLVLLACLVVLLWVFPLSFAYAVVKHRVLEIPVLLRRSARYLLVQRGFVILLIALSVGVTLAFALSFSRYLESFTSVAMPGAIALGSVFGSVLLWTGVQVHNNVGRRIDRAFFRNAYDARVVMEELLAKIHTVTNRDELAALLEHHLREALQPSSDAVYLESNDAQLVMFTGNLPPEGAKYSPAQPGLRELAKLGRPWDVTSDAINGAPLPGSLLSVSPECLVPIRGRDSRLAGLILLGTRLSEEPYSREDKRLLSLVANQAGVALESIVLAEKIAERMEAERRVTQEMDFARQVQARLLPQNLPAMKTLQYAGQCLPALKVGGDYYDFLELRPGRLGLVLADIAGKGVAGALLMANLQANLRSQYAMAVEDLPRLLSSVNRLFFQSTNQSSYATMVFADYDDTTRVLRYANCGHLPALILRTSQTGAVAEWLDSTSTVLGLFEELPIKVAEIKLRPGDTFVLYTDGVTEAANPAGEEFGEQRLVEVLTNSGAQSATELTQAVCTAVEHFSPGEQFDDITLVVARCTS